jgi:site-specific DNA recombinase
MSGKPIDIYARESDETGSRSLEGQITDCRAVLADRRLPEGEVLREPGRSAWNPKVKRPKWDILMERLESGKSGGVIVYDIERFARRPVDGERLIAAAESGLTVLDSESEYDLTTANGKKQFRDALNAAAYYSDRLSARVRRGKRIKAMAGEPGGRVTAGRGPFGFAPDGVTPDPVTAPELREMTARFLSGESQNKILGDLNARGVPTGTGGRWTRAGLRQVLTRPVNAGLVEHRGVIVGKVAVYCVNCGRSVERDGDGWKHTRDDKRKPCTDLAVLPEFAGGYVPVISEEDFGRVLATYAGTRTGRQPSEGYIASGFAVCGRCGHRLHGRPRRNMAPYRDGEPRREYLCNKTAGGCGRIAIDQRALDAAATELVVAILSDPRHAAQVEEAARQAAGKAVELDAQIADAEALATRLADRLGRGEITLDRYDAATAPLDARLGKLRAERAALGEGIPAEGVPSGSEQEWRERWDTGEVGEKRALLRMALRGRKIAVGPADPSARTNVAGRLDLITP